MKKDMIVNSGELDGGGFFRLSPTDKWEKMERQRGEDGERVGGMTGSGNPKREERWVSVLRMSSTALGVMLQRPE